jgi:septum formation protein
MLNFSKNLILASQSPRRSQLLQQAGFSFSIQTKPIDESFPNDLPVTEVAPYLAKEKALAAKSFLQDQNDILLTADSVVILNQTIFGKPKDAEDAHQMLSKLSGNTHEVITGVCLLSLNQEKVFAGHSKVTMEELTDEEIEYYVKKFQPFDKAGSYAIQEWIGLCKISKIEGTYSNIMGLPMDLVYQELSAFDS